MISFSVKMKSISLMPATQRSWLLQTPVAALPKYILIGALVYCGVTLGPRLCCLTRDGYEICHVYKSYRKDKMVNFENG